MAHKVDPNLPTYNKVETAPYNVLRTWENENVELRQYGPLVWVCSSTSEKSVDDVGKTCFWKLFKYISGKNISGVKIPMTSPVLIEASVDPNRIDQYFYTMGFYVPSAYHNSPIEPKAVDVSIVSKPPMNIYTRLYSGFSKNKTFWKESENLKISLDKLGMKYRKEPVCFFGYDSPFKLSGRRNEVWYIAA